MGGPAGPRSALAQRGPAARREPARTRAHRRSRAPGGSNRPPLPARTPGRHLRPAWYPRSTRRSPRRSRPRRSEARLSSREVPHVEHALEDPVVEARLAKLVAVENRPDALPALLEEVEQCAVGVFSADAVEPVHDACGAVHTEAALTGPHPQPQEAPDVVQVGGGAPAYRVLERRARDHLALADELLVDEPRLLARQARPQLIVPTLLGARQGLGRRGTGPLF